MSSPNVALAAPPAPVFVLAQQAVIDAAKRELLSRDRAITLLAPLLPPAPAHHPAAVTQLVLGGKSFGSDSVPVLADALLHMHALQHADFADCIAARPTDEALDTLEALCDAIAANPKIQLTHLNLSDNALGVRGIPKIKNAFKNQVRRQADKHAAAAASGTGREQQLRHRAPLFAIAPIVSQPRRLCMLSVRGVSASLHVCVCILPVVAAAPLFQQRRSAGGGRDGAH
jgi:hypothetical protein